MIGDPFEVSTLKRDDYQVVAGKSEYEDLLQSTNNPSTAEPRGHNFPAAFMIVGSGLDKVTHFSLDWFANLKVNKSNF